MKKVILSVALACASGLAAHAQLNGDGYYRIQNSDTKRYMSLCDNHSRGVNASTTTVDAGALVTKKNLDEVLTDPGTIFYIQSVGNNNYNIHAQGNNLHDMINYYVCLTKLSDGTYTAWQTNGTILFLGDDTSYFKYGDISYVTTFSGNPRNWYIKPVDTADNYIGVQPTIEKDGKYYTTYFAEYPFSFASTGMKAYYINSVNANGVATYKEIEGVIPAKTPVIIECSSKNPVDNKLKLENSSTSNINDNKLTGVYFCLGMRPTSHYNSTPFDQATMRVLGLDKDGNLVLNNETTYMSDVLVKKGQNNVYTYETIKAIPHNTAYVKVAENMPTELKLYKNGDPAAGIVEIEDNSAAKPANVYNMNGMVVRKNATSVEGLPQGMYIFKNKKYVVK